jgi:1-acyl-sn-glycerol-3-phosphate acyltransferase
LLLVIILPLFPVAWLVWLLTGRLDPHRDGLRVLTANWASLYGRTSPLYRFRIEGRERLPDGPHVLVANHESGLDILCLLLLRTRARFLAETWMFRIPLSGALFRRCRHIPLEPGDRESGRRALFTAAEALAEGTPVAIFPEGKMTPGGPAEFRPGAFVLAHRAGVPLVPVLLEGTGRAWRPGTMVVQGRHEIRISVLEPLSEDEVKSAEPDLLSARVRAMLVAARRGAADAANPNRLRSP